MAALPEKLYRTHQVRTLDRVAIEKLGISSYSLMGRAGEAAFARLRMRWPRARRLLVMAGVGNNGGDGYVLARLAHKAGLHVGVVQVGDIGRIRGDARLARHDYLTGGGAAERFNGQRLPPADMIVDALLGTGLQREVGDQWRAAVDAVNAHPAPVLAVDVPSGLQSDTGMPLNAAVQAECTVTYIALKQGLFTGRAADYCGDIEFDSLQVPVEVYAHERPAARRIELAQFHEVLRPRPRASHKGDFGHVLIVGGERGMSGAARLAGEAAARVGAGLVSLATRAEHAALIGAACPTLMTHGAESAAELEALLARATVVAVGPGLGQGAWGQSMLAAVLETGKPLVIDADALNLLAREPLRRENWVLTPHPGEAGRLLSSNTGRVQTDRFAAAEALQQRFGGICVLKGAGTLIRDTQGTAVCAPGNPGMAAGGMGDVLTGVIAGLIAQDMTLAQAARVGVCLHAAAADRAAAMGGERGMQPTDLYESLRVLANP